MDHDQTPVDGRRDGARAEPAASSAGTVTGKGERLAAAAQAAVEGLHGSRRGSSRPWGIAARSPGVETLFGPSRTARPQPDPTPSPGAGSADPVTREPTRGLEAGPEHDLQAGPEHDVQAAPALDAGTEPAAPSLGAGRPRIEALHVQCTATEATVDATLRHPGGTVRGTATALPTAGGVRRAVAEATVDAVGRLTDAPLLVGVDAVTLTPLEDTSSVTVVLTRATGDAERTYLGVSLVSGDDGRAVMQATLDALNRVVTGPRRA